MVENTFNYNGVAVPAVPDSHGKLPFRVKMGYIYKILTNKVHIIGAVDVSHVKDERYMEGRLRVMLTPREAADYHVYGED